MDFFIVYIDMKHPKINNTSVKPKKNDMEA